ncbi:ATP-grasp domain-containing protein [Streptomyces sasae]|uniref:ATP-grasp domain-containing protein n=1 Tax=Streptomyces sasae TaxID=1266772 RepID=UPI00292F77D6|nr:ATP-grasp domain-containing protein [Streptomyces sasae]
MTEPDGTAILLCKWHPTLLEELLARTPDVYVVLDDFDVEHMHPDQVLLDKTRGVYRVSSFDSIEELSSIAVDLTIHHVIVGKIVSHTEFSQYGAGLLELLLHGGEDPLKFTAYRDKRLMKARVRAAGVPTARSCSLAGPDDLTAAHRAMATLRFPVVVKPASGFGTMSTLKVERPEDLLDTLTGYTFEPLLRSRQLIIEEFITGDEVCVDALWSGGEALSFVVHSYYRPRIGLTAESLHEDSGLNGSRVLTESDHPELYRELRQLHNRINQGLRIKDGATHLEVFVQQDGTIVFSEIATRVGGAWVPRMLSAYLGREVWAAIAEAAVTGDGVPARPRRPYVGGVNISPLQPGLITAMPDEAELASHPGVLDWQVIRGLGSRVSLTHPSEWCLFLVLGADSAQEYEELRREATERFFIETHEGEQ